MHKIQLLCFLKYLGFVIKHGARVVANSAKTQNKQKKGKLTTTSYEEGMQKDDNDTQNKM